MNIDDRATRAADSLRRRVEPEIDLTVARAAVGAGASARRSRVNRLRAGGAVVAVAAILGAGAYVGTDPGPSDETSGRVDADDGTSNIEGDANAAEILGALPRGPVDGKDSWQLPVVAKPQSGVSDGDTVTIYGRGFTANEPLGIVQCSSEAGDAGIAACQLASAPPEGGQQLDLSPEQRQTIDAYLALLPEGTTWDESQLLPQPPNPGNDLTNGTIPPGLQRIWEASDKALDAWYEAGGVYPDGFGEVTYADAAADGTVVADVQVRRYITTPDGAEIDCKSGPERCLIGVGAISNYDQSGGTYINFEGAPPFPEPALALDPGGEPAGTFEPGQQITARVTGLMPERQVRVSQCIEDQCETLLDGKVDADGAASLAVRIQPDIIDEETNDQVACEDRCVIRIDGIGTAGASSAPMPDDIAILFSSADPAVTVAPSTEPEGPATAPPTTTPAITDTAPSPVLPGTAPCPAGAICTDGSVPPTTSATTSEVCNDTPGQDPVTTCVPGLTVPISGSISPGG